MDMLRAAFGPDANLSGLAVYEAVMMNTLPLRKSGGLFKNARASLSLLTEMAASINAESLPLQLEHNTAPVPFGRVFHASVVDDQLRGLFATDNPDLIAKLDSGVADQVSVGFSPKALNCSSCGFNFASPSAEFNRWTLTCDEGHTIGDNNVYCHIDGLELFLETSVVGKGAVQGAKIVGPSDARLQSNEQFQIAAAARGDMIVLELTADEKPAPQPTQEPPKMELTARLEELAGEKAVLSARIAALEPLQEQVTTLSARVAELEPLAARVAPAEEAVTKAVAALKAEATTILTACGKTEVAIPEDVDALLALINDHRAQFAAAVPVGGRAKTADTASAPEPGPSIAAFRSPSTVR